MKMGKATKEPEALAVQRMDNWYNAYTGLGDPSRDSAAAMRVSIGFETLSQQERDSLFHGNHIVYKACTKLPDDALRNWVTLQIEGADEGTADKILDDVKTRFYREVNECLVLARLDGGCLLVLGVDDGQDPALPLATEMVNGKPVPRIKSFEFANVVRKDQALAAKYYEDPTQPKFKQVELWSIKNDVGGSEKLVHETRCIRFRGSITTPQRRKELRGWDVSVLDRARGPLSRIEQAFQALANLITKSNFLAFAVKGYTTMVKTAATAAAAFAGRMGLARMAQSINSWVVYDAEGEKVENIAVNFGGVSDAMDRQMMETASAVDMQVTDLWGRSPAGMNATGESDLVLWDQRVSSYQKNYVEEPLTALIRFAMLTPGSATNGKEPESWSLTFNPLRVMTPEQAANVQLTVAQAAALLITHQVVTPEGVAIGPMFGDTGPLASLATVDTAGIEAMLEAEKAEAEKAASGGATAGPDVQEQALNGAQIASALEIATSVNSRAISTEQAAALLDVAFPTMSPDQRARIAKPAPQPVIPTAPPPAAPIPPKAAE